MTSYTEQQWTKLCQSVRESTSKELGEHAWYLIITAALTTSPSPHLVAQFYTHLRSHNDNEYDDVDASQRSDSTPDAAENSNIEHQQQQSTLQKQSRPNHLVRLHDALLKLIPLIGAPQVLSALIPLAKSEAGNKANLLASSKRSVLSDNLIPLATSADALPSRSPSQTSSNKDCSQADERTLIGNTTDTDDCGRSDDHTNMTKNSLPAMPVHHSSSHGVIDDSGDSSGDDKPKNINAEIFARGHKTITSIYGTTLLPRIFDTWGPHLADFRFHSIFSTYGLFLSDNHVLDPLETEAVAYTSITCTGLRGPALWHLRGMGRLLGLRGREAEQKGEEEEKRRGGMERKKDLLRNLKIAVMTVVEFVGEEFVRRARMEEWANVGDVSRELGGWGDD